MKKNYKMIDLNPEESVLKIAHHYFLTLFPNLLVCFLILIFDFFLMFYLFSLGLLGMIVFFTTMVIITFYVGRLLFLWNHNFVVITNQRIIDYERSGFFQKLTTEIGYNKIKSVSIGINRLSQKIFRFGDLNLGIVNQPMDFTLYNLKNPTEILSLINTQLVGDQTMQSNSEIISTRKMVDYEELLYQVGQLDLEKKKKLFHFLKNDLNLDYDDTEKK